MNCKKCGSPLTTDSKFCNVCGAEVGQDINQNTMVNPGNEVNQNNDAINQGMANEAVLEPQNSNVNNVNPNNNGGGLGIEQVPNNNMGVTAVDQNTNQGGIQPPINNVSQANNQTPAVKTSGVNKTGLIVVIVAVVVVVGLVVVLALTGGIKFKATITSNGTTKQFNGGTTNPVNNGNVTSPANNENTSTTRPKTTYPASSSGSFNVFEKIKQIDLNTVKTYDQVVELMGMEGTKDESSTLNKYIWTQDDKKSIEIVFYISEINEKYNSITSVNVKYERDDLRDANVDLSNAMNFVNTINDKVPVYYKEISSSFGTDGNLVEVTSYSREYVWVNANGGYVTARFNQETSQCTYFFAVVR